MDLKTLRKSLHIKQTHAAQICGTNQSEYSRVESGLRGWRQEEFSQRILAQAMSPCIRLTLEKQGI